MQHVIDAVIGTRLFYRGDVGRLLHHTYEALVARWAGAVDAWFDISDVAADRAEMQALFEIADGGGQRFGLIFTTAQNVKGKSLRGLAAHAGKLFQFIDEPRHGLGKFRQEDRP